MEKDTNDKSKSRALKLIEAIENEGVHVLQFDARLREAKIIVHCGDGNYPPGSVFTRNFTDDKDKEESDVNALKEEIAIMKTTIDNLFNALFKTLELSNQALQNHLGG